MRSSLVAAVALVATLLGSIPAFSDTVEWGAADEAVLIIVHKKKKSKKSSFKRKPVFFDRIRIEPHWFDFGSSSAEIEKLEILFYTDRVPITLKNFVVPI